MHHIEFNDAGFRVIGLHAIVGGKCSCEDEDCQLAGKHPRVRSWQYTPVWDDEQIDGMESMGHFKTGYGVLMGSDLVVIDVDSRNGGVESWSRFAEDYPSVSSCGLIVETGSGGGSKHLYFRAPEGVALLRHLKEYPGLDFQSGNCFVVGPGSLHRSGKRYKIVHGSIDEIFPLPDDITDALRKPERVRTEYNGGHVDVSNSLMESIMGSIPPAEDYETWIKVGMGINHAMAGDGFEIWDRWSSKAKNYDDSVMFTKWASFGRASQPVTLGTLVYMAEQNGWKWPVEFFDQDDVVLLESPTSETVNLKRPPGFVGEVTQWINSQCMYPRENLAVMCALVAVGAIGGIRHVDKRTSVTSNLMAFCVAGSATGKDAVLDAMTELFVVAGMGRTLNGRLKSDTEIIRSLIEHQPATYVIDEIGMELTKVVNSSKKGTTPYLEGLLPTIMSVFTKANSRVLLGGDEARDIRKLLVNEIAAINKQMDQDGETPQLRSRLDSATSRLNSIDAGLVRPFLSAIGFTTPETFNSVMGRDMATNGFVGRCIIVQEKDDNPWPKEDMSRPPLPDSIANTLRSLATGDEYDSTARRIEFFGERVQIPFTKEAGERSREIQMYFLEKAGEMAEQNGLVALARRAHLAVEKVSLILAMAEGLRTVEHVNWAFEFIKRDLFTKVNMVVATDDGGKTFSALKARLENLLDKEEGKSFGVIKHKLMKYKEEDIRKALEKMGARSETSVHPRNKKTIEKWYLS